MDFSRGVCSKEAEDSFIGRKGYDDDFFGMRAANGVILMDFLEKGRTIAGQYYSELLERLHKKVKRTQPNLAKKGAVSSR